MSRIHPEAPVAYLSKFDQLNKPASDGLDRTSSRIRDGFCSLLEKLEYELAVG
jgi:hypothetical protein